MTIQRWSPCLDYDTQDQEPQADMTDNQCGSYVMYDDHAQAIAKLEADLAGMRGEAQKVKDALDIYVAHRLLVELKLAKTSDKEWIIQEIRNWGALCDAITGHDTAKAFATP